MRQSIDLQKAAMLMCIAVYNCTVYWGAKLIVQNRPHFYLGLTLDEKIPLIPWTVYIYVGWYLFCCVNYTLAVRGSMEQARRFVLAELIAKTVCFLFYVLLPTTIVRPDIAGKTLSENILRTFYRMDSPDNLLPSIHCLASWFCYIGIRKLQTIPKWYRVSSCVFALAVCISTLTVRQHVLADVFAGIFLAEVCYRAIGKLRF